MRGAEPFYLPGGDIGCLLLHGFTGTPFEMRWLGDQLANHGYSVHAPRLFAHATQVKDIVRARWKDWVASAEDGYHLLNDVCSQIIVMGLSMGGVLSLYVSSYLPVTGVVAMSTPYDMPYQLAKRFRRILPSLSLVWRYRTKRGRSDWHDSEAAESHLDYASYPVRGGSEVDNLLRLMRRSLPGLEIPVLLIHSKGDLSVSGGHAHAIHEAISSKHKQLVWVTDSGHVVPRDAERQTVFANVVDFIQRATS